MPSKLPEVQVYVSREKVRIDFWKAEAMKQKLYLRGKESAFREWFKESHKSAVMAVAMTPIEMIGCAFAVQNDPKWNCNMGVYLKPDWRRMGIGSRLLAAMLYRIPKTWELKPFRGNMRSERFYSILGD